MTHRDIERARAIEEAAKEKPNSNGMHRAISPPSTRTAEVARHLATILDDPKPAPRDHSTGAGTSSLQLGVTSSVRERLNQQTAQQRDQQQEQPRRTPEQIKSDEAWEEMEERHRNRSRKGVWVW